MPLVTEKQFLQSQGLPPREKYRLFAREELHDDSVLDVAAAAYRQHNIITNAFYGERPDRQREAGSEFDAVQAMKDLNRLDVGEAGIYADNMDELNTIINQFDRGEKQKEIIRRNGWTGMALSAAAGAIDPTLLIPVAGAASKGAAGARILKSFGITGGTAAGIVASQEALLQMQQINRDAETTIGSIVGAGILGGVLGGAASGLSRSGSNHLHHELLTRTLEDAASPTILLQRREMPAFQTSGVGEQLVDFTSILPKKTPEVAPAVKLQQLLDGAEEVDLQRLLDDVPRGTSEKDILKVEKLLDDADSALLQKNLAKDQAIGLQKMLDDVEELSTKPLTTKTKNKLQGLLTELEGNQLQRILDESQNANVQKILDDLEQLPETIRSKKDKEILSSAQKTFNKLIKSARDNTQKILDDSQAANVQKILDDAERANVESILLSGIPRLSAKTTETPPIAGVFQKQDPAVLQREAKEFVDSTLDDSAGAAAATWEARLDQYNARLTDDGIANVNEKLANVLALNNKLTRSPTTANLLSPFATNRMIATDLFEHNFLLPKNMRGESSGKAVETLMKLDQAQRVQTSSKVKNLFLQFAGIDRGVFKQSRALAQGFSKKELSWKRFNEEVARAMRREDTSPIPEVQEAARLLRKDMDRLVQKMQELEILPKELDVKTAASYFRRVYDVQKILADRAGSNVFKRRLIKYFSRTHSDLSERGISDLADETIDKILGLGENTLQLNELTALATKGAKFTKERKLLIDDSEIEDFLVNDALQVYNAYADQASALIRFNEKLRERGFTSGEDYIREIRNEFKVRSDAIKAEFDKRVSEALPDEVLRIEEARNKAALKLAKEQADSERLIRDSIGITLGQYTSTSKIPGLDNGLKALRKYQTMRLLGGVVLSSIPDIVGPVLKHGLPRTIIDGYVPLIKNFKQANLARDQLKDLNIGLELEMNSILKSIVDPDYQLGRLETASERAFDFFVQGFGKATGMSYWNRFHRRLAGHVSTAAILRSLDQFAKLGDLPKHEIGRLAKLGIDKDDFSLILNNFNRFGEKVDGSYIANFHLWDEKAKDIFSAAVIRDTDSTILIPSKGDLPFSTQGSELGKTIFQFKSFAAASTNKLLLSTLQERPAKIVHIFAFLVAAGAATYAIKERLRGKTPSTDIDTLLLEGVSRSGAAGVLGDLVIGLNPYGTSSRYAGLNAQSLILGPSSNLIMDTYKALQGVTDGDLTDSDIKRIARTLPYQNVFWLRMLIEQLSE